jgi:hypothetical protein
MNMELYNKNFKVNLVSEIEKAFKCEYVHDMIEENTTEYYTKVSDIIKIDDKYYKVTDNFNVVGLWQDVGDKLYTIDEVTSVEYEEVEYNKLINDFNYSVNNQIQKCYEKIKMLESKLILTNG